MAKSRGVRRVATPAQAWTGDAKIDRAQGELSRAVREVVSNPLSHAVALEVELEWGVNRLDHGLAVPVAHFLYAAPSSPGVSITSAQADNPHPDKQVWVELQGSAAAKALLFLLPVT